MIKNFFWPSKLVISLKLVEKSFIEVPEKTIYIRHVKFQVEFLSMKNGMGSTPYFSWYKPIYGLPMISTNENLSIFKPQVQRDLMQINS